jgi:hypothetical protein
MKITGEIENWVSGMGHRASGIGHQGWEVESSNILYSSFFLLHA